MLLRSERESKPSGAALIRVNLHGGNLFLSTLPATPHLEKAQQLIDKLLTNLGARTNTTTSILQPNGDLTPDLRNLQPGTEPNQAWLDFWISSPRSLDDLLAEPDIPVVDFQLSAEIRQVWLNNNLLLSIDQKSHRQSAKTINPEQTPPPSASTDFRHTLPALRLLQGWNHFHILLQQGPDGWTFTGRLTSNHPEFLKTLSATAAKP